MCQSQRQMCSHVKNTCQDEHLLEETTLLLGHRHSMRNAILAAAAKKEHRAKRRNQVLRRKRMLLLRSIKAKAAIALMQRLAATQNNLCKKGDQRQGISNTPARATMPSAQAREVPARTRANKFQQTHSITWYASPQQRLALQVC